MSWDGLPDATALESLGVKRLSAGSAITQAVWSQAARMARDFLESGQSEHLSSQIPYSQMQALFI
jgi:2-methylisocitrate lyase-like PEP mutase family enzyme